MPRAGTLLRFTAVTILCGVALLLPVASSCEAAITEAIDEPSLTLNWSFGEPGCDLTLTGRVTERRRLRFSARLACPTEKPIERRVGTGSARL